MRLLNLVHASQWEKEKIAGEYERESQILIKDLKIRSDNRFFECFFIFGEIFFKTLFYVY